MLATLMKFGASEYQAVSSVYGRAGVQRFLRELDFSHLPAGTEMVKTISVPSGIQGFEFSDRGEYWELRVNYRGESLVAQSKSKVLFEPPDLAFRPGTHRVLVWKESGRSVVIREMPK